MDGRQDPFPPALVLEHIRMETVTGDFREAFSRHNIHCAVCRRCLRPRSSC